MPEGFQLNKFIKILTFSDLLVVSSFGLINPIFAVFLTDYIQGGSLALAGLAVTVFLVSKSLFQIPVAWVLDATKGDDDEFYSLCFGYFLICLVPFLYIFASRPAHIVFIQFFYGLGGAFTSPAWTALFTRHVDREKTSFNWSFYSTTVSLATAATAATGAFIAQNFGFKTLFFLVGFFTLWASISILIFYRYLKKTYPEILEPKKLNPDNILVRGVNQLVSLYRLFKKEKEKESENEEFKTDS